MSAPLIVRTGSPAPLPEREECEALVRDFLASKTRATWKNYEGDLKHLATFLGVETPVDAARLVLRSHREANTIALRWKGEMETRLSPATVNRRLSAMRSMVKMARLLGMISWTIDVEGAPVQTYRNTKAVSWQRYVEVLGREKLTPCERAILRLMGDRGLRRAEVESLTIADVTRDGGAVWVKGKGRRGQRELLTLAGTTTQALLVWVKERGTEPGPLFLLPDGRKYDDRHIYALCKMLGFRPHDLRHLAVTRALDVMEGDVRKVAQFSRHATVQTVLRYDDAREDFGGVVAKRMQGG